MSKTINTPETATQVATATPETATQVATQNDNIAKVLSFVVPNSKKMLADKNKLENVATALSMANAKNVFEMYRICRAVYEIKKGEMFKELPAEYNRQTGKYDKWTWNGYATVYLKMSRAKADQLARIGELFIDENDNSIIPQAFEYSKLDEMLNGLSKLEKDDLKKRVAIIKGATDLGEINATMGEKECREKVVLFGEWCKRLQLSYDCQKEVFEQAKHEWEIAEFNRKAQEIHDNGGLTDNEIEKANADGANKAQAEKDDRAQATVNKAQEAIEKAQRLAPCTLEKLVEILNELPFKKGEIVLTTDKGAKYCIDINKK